MQHQLGRKHIKRILSKVTCLNNQIHLSIPQIKVTLVTLFVYHTCTTINSSLMRQYIEIKADILKDLNVFSITL